MSLLLTLKSRFGVSIIDFEQVEIGWVTIKNYYEMIYYMKHLLNCRRNCEGLIKLMNILIPLQLSLINLVLLSKQQHVM